jgi:hypothetical protein
VEDDGSAVPRLPEYLVCDRLDIVIERVARDDGRRVHRQARLPHQRVVVGVVAEARIAKQHRGSASKPRDRVPGTRDVVEFVGIRAQRRQAVAVARERGMPVAVNADDEERIVRKSVDEIRIRFGEQAAHEDCSGNMVLLQKLENGRVVPGRHLAAMQPPQHGRRHVRVECQVERVARDQLDVARGFPGLSEVEGSPATCWRGNAQRGDHHRQTDHPHRPNHGSPRCWHFSIPLAQQHTSGRPAPSSAEPAAGRARSPACRRGTICGCPSSSGPAARLSPSSDSRS